MTFKWDNKDLNQVTGHYFKHTFHAAVQATLGEVVKFSSSALNLLDYFFGWRGVYTTKSSLDKAYYC